MTFNHERQLRNPTATLLIIRSLSCRRPSPLAIVRNESAMHHTSHAGGWARQGVLSGRLYGSGRAEGLWGQSIWVWLAMQERKAVLTQILSATQRMKLVLHGTGPHVETSLHWGPFLGRTHAHLPRDPRMARALVEITTACTGRRIYWLTSPWILIRALRSWRGSILSLIRRLH